jgi:hypothetical protein
MTHRTSQTADGSLVASLCSRAHLSRSLSRCPAPLDHVDVSDAIQLWLYVTRLISGVNKVPHPTPPHRIPLLSTHRLHLSTMSTAPGVPQAPVTATEGPIEYFMFTKYSPAPQISYTTSISEAQALLERRRGRSLVSISSGPSGGLILRRGSGCMRSERRRCSRCAMRS